MLDKEDQNMYKETKIAGYDLYLESCDMATWIHIRKNVNIDGELQEVTGSLDMIYQTGGMETDYGNFWPISDALRDRFFAWGDRNGY